MEMKETVQMVLIILETETERWGDMTWACTPAKGQMGLTCIPGALGKTGYQEIVGDRHSSFQGTPGRPLADLLGAGKAAGCTWKEWAFQGPLVPCLWR